MQLIDERCAGLDVPKQTLVACILTPEGPETRTFHPTLPPALASAVSVGVPSRYELSIRVLG
jgi:hypothetical protein